jgi:hypothetical protein
MRVEGDGAMSEASGRKLAWRYGLLLLAETLCVAWLFWFVLPIFRQFFTNLGTFQDIDVRDELAIIAGTAALQALYWIRFGLPLSTPRSGACSWPIS